LNEKLTNLVEGNKDGITYPEFIEWGRKFIAKLIANKLKNEYKIIKETLKIEE